MSSKECYRKSAVEYQLPISYEINGKHIVLDTKARLEFSNLIVNTNGISFTIKNVCNVEKATDDVYKITTTDGNSYIGANFLEKELQKDEKFNTLLKKLKEDGKVS